VARNMLMHEVCQSVSKKNACEVWIANTVYRYEKRSTRASAQSEVTMVIVRFWSTAFSASPYAGMEFGLFTESLEQGLQWVDRWIKQGDGIENGSRHFNAEVLHDEPDPLLVILDGTIG